MTSKNVEWWQCPLINIFLVPLLIGLSVATWQTLFDKYLDKRHPDLFEVNVTKEVGEIKPRVDEGPVTGAVIVMSADMAGFLPDPKVVSNADGFRVIRESPQKQRWEFESIPQGGFFRFAYNEPIEINKIRIVDPITGKTVYLGKPPVIGADVTAVSTSRDNK